MRRLHILSLLLLVVLLPLAAACGGPVETPTSTQGATEAPAVTEEPEATEETDEAEEPEATDDAEDMEEPEATEETDEAEEPEATEETDEADATEEPEATEETDEAEEPEATEETDEADATEEPEATEEAGAEEEGEQIRIGLVTDIGRVNDGTFNQFAHEGAELAAEEFGLEYDYIETQSQADYAENIQTFVDEGYDVIVTVGFLIADATFAAAQENPDVTFIGVDQSFTGERALPNVSGIQFREDQSGFLVGALAGMMTESDIVGFVGGMEIPPRQEVPQRLRQRYHLCQSRCQAD